MLCSQGDNKAKPKAEAKKAPKKPAKPADDEEVRDCGSVALATPCQNLFTHSVRLDRLIHSASILGR
jgi:hypothetical protein